MFGKASAIAFVAMLGIATALPATASPFYFSTGNPDNQMAAASRPASIEAADDFFLTANTSITGATFTGLLPDGSSVQSVQIEIYRVFPNNFRHHSNPSSAYPRKFAIGCGICSAHGGSADIFHRSFGAFVHCAQQRAAR